MYQNLFFGAGLSRDVLGKAGADIFLPEAGKKNLEPELGKNGSAPQH